MAIPLSTFWFGPPPGAGNGEGQRQSRENTLLVLPALLASDDANASENAVAHAVGNGVSDGELVAKIRASDVAAFEQLYHQTFEALWGFAATLLGGREGAEDVVHDVFLDVWRRRAEWTVHGAVRGYLFGAVRNHVLTLRRRMGVGDRIVAASEASIPSSVPAPDADAEQIDITARIRQVVDQLPERQRAAVLLRWLGELNATEIGRQLAISETAVRKLLLKAEHTLRESIGDLIG